MKKIAFTVLVCCMFFGSLSAALPPLFQDLSELHAVLNDKLLGQRLSSGEPIKSIIHVENGYWIITNKSKLLAEIVYEPSTKPGPAKFTVKFNEVEPIKS